MKVCEIVSAAAEIALDEWHVILTADVVVRIITMM